ncbi:sugar diacid recognition domain-containing protein [Endozoicomonas sp. YOMI1]|uniref:sugar diacid recognition domain-containing protein n=1 Tax=Endozoicomonas sp. YOMI1 TaxID=2828739 RepID=UPI0021487AB1|nr:sugar diacid recognition domain-containing protein [Endozoicomonas sp. YOMI1]
MALRLTDYLYKNFSTEPVTQQIVQRTMIIPLHNVNVMDRAGIIIALFHGRYVNTDVWHSSILRE